jgi:ABC-type bacteriocin/lantibiotic exporter with double-glycine peptidase domain
MTTLALLVALAATGAPATGLWLDVPFVRQAGNGCGPACAAMVARYWNAARGGSSADPAAAAASESPTPAREMERSLGALGFRVFTFGGEWSDLEQHLARGRPLIVAVKARAAGPLHYLVVCGVDSEQRLVLVNDPARRKLVTLERAAFEKGWRASGNWTLLALP